MKQTIMAGVISILSLSACSDDDVLTIDSAKPEGTFTIARDGSFMEQNSTGSMGTAALGSDSQGTEFLKFESDFNTNLATGTVTVYLSTSMTYMADPGNGNPDLLLVGIVNKSGENYFKIDPAAPSKFTHVILWCGSANIPFGYAELN
jgi:hypothetical protein